jgi:hypothetical protein
VSRKGGTLAEMLSMKCRMEMAKLTVKTNHVV